MLLLPFHPAVKLSDQNLVPERKKKNQFIFFPLHLDSVKH